jgi:beta-galactosidase GanA
VKRLIVALIAGVAVVSAAARAHGQGRGEGIPQLRKQGTATQLVVDGAPFLILGGELGNSSASSLEYLRPYWPKLRAMHLNTVLAPVSWELMEPVEGRFNFANVDSLLADARANDMRLVLLWFGSWKNSMSSYAPAWVKTNQYRFPRTEATRGHGQEILSPFGAANVDADSRAFAALMRHLRSADAARHTVIMVQVENEIGMIPEARDHSALADSLFARSVPATLMAYLSGHRDGLAPALRARWDSAGGKTSGTWQGVFGRGPYTDELFMAWHFARYAERVAAAGKAEYPLPMYVNAALIRYRISPKCGAPPRRRSIYSRRTSTSRTSSSGPETTSGRGIRCSSPRSSSTLTRRSRRFTRSAPTTRSGSARSRSNRRRIPTRPRSVALTRC